jgi:RNA polymerase sigma factor (sigma-70 family)
LWNLLCCWWIDDDVRISSEPAATQGSSISFDDFYSEVWPRAFRLASFLTHDTQVGEDIAQEVLAAMSRRWDVLARPEAYLQRAVTNESWKWNRHARTATRKLPLLAMQSGDEFRFDELADAIARLPFRQRAVIVLRYYADLTETDIAHALDCRRGTVKSLASRALAALSKEITP